MLNSTIKDFLVFDLTQDIFYSFPSLRLCLNSNSLFVQILSLQNFAPYLFCNITFANGTNFLPQADPRFLWNNYLLEPLIDRKVATQIQICDPIFPALLYSIFRGSWCWPFVWLCSLQLDRYLLPVIQGNILSILFACCCMKLHQGLTYFRSHDKMLDLPLCTFELLNWLSRFQHFQAAIGKDIADVTLIARRCTRRNGTFDFARLQ